MAQILHAMQRDDVGCPDKLRQTSRSRLQGCDPSLRLLLLAVVGLSLGKASISSRFSRPIQGSIG